MSYISVGLRLLLSIAFLGAGGSKLAGVEMMVMTFDQIGWGQGFRYVTGAIEVIGVVLVWLPRRQVIGAAVLGGTDCTRTKVLGKDSNLHVHTDTST